MTPRSRTDAIRIVPLHRPELQIAAPAAAPHLVYQNGPLIATAQDPIPQDPQPVRTPESKTPLTRRELLAHCTALGAASTLLTGFHGTTVAPDAFSEEVLIGASKLSGEALTQKRVQAMKPLLEFNLKHLEILREFDPDEEEPLTMFWL
jgi:hypothetical protein